eukprot:2604168-Amphidinium_carterae.1
MPFMITMTRQPNGPSASRTIPSYARLHGHVGIPSAQPHHAGTSIRQFPDTKDLRSTGSASRVTPAKSDIKLQTTASTPSSQTS